jgi:hypothetical protein
MAEEKRRKRDVKHANLAGLSESTKKLYNAYKTDYDKSLTSAKTLRLALNKEWAGHNPDGKNGKECRFNVLNGAVLYEWIDKGIPEEEGEVLFP